MNKRDKFKLFKVQQSLTFKKKLTKTQLEEAFAKLIKISFFDGAKIIDDKQRKDGNEKFIKIMTVDNKVVLDVDSEDMSLGYLCDIFNEDTKERSQLENFHLFQGIVADLGYDIDYARYRRVWVGDAVEVRKATITHVMSPAYGNKVDEMDIELDLTGDKSLESNDPSHFARVTTFHTTEMHDQFEKNELEDRLESLIVVDEYRVIGDKISLEDVETFLHTEAKRKVTGPEI